MQVIRFEYEKRYIKDFVNLPKRLYSKETNMEDAKNMELLLLNKHVMSKYFKLHKFLVYDGDKALGRFAITEYEDDPIAYLGFFECENNKEAAKTLFDEAYKYAKDKGFTKLVGPVDASFWIKYRLKINLFDKRPYTGEPYNLDYYKELFDDNGYKVCEHYVSNIYKIPESDFKSVKYKEHYNEFINNGYEIVSPSIEDYDLAITQVYELIVKLYSDFPIFKTLSKEDFCEQFSSYKQIINMDMVKMAYKDNKAAGFFISIPNYHNKVYHTNNIFNIIDILKTRKRPKEYVMLYMGVGSDHTGLGKALVQAIIDTLIDSGLPSVGALMRDGKITQNYVSEMIDTRYEYVLMEKII